MTLHVYRSCSVSKIYFDPRSGGSMVESLQFEG